MPLIPMTMPVNRSVGSSSLHQGNRGYPMFADLVTMYHVPNHAREGSCQQILPNYKGRYSRKRCALASLLHCLIPLRSQPNLEHLSLLRIPACETTRTSINDTHILPRYHHVRLLHSRSTGHDCFHSSCRIEQHKRVSTEVRA